MSAFAEVWGLRMAPTKDGTEFSCQSPDGKVHVAGAACRTERGLVISRMEWSTEHPMGIVGQMHRDFPIVELIANLRAVEVPPQPDGESTGESVPLSDEHLRQVALAYLDETGPGKPRGAAKRLAQRFGRPERTIHRWVSLARQGGWLEPTWQGRRGAEPGPRLLDGGSA